MELTLLTVPDCPNAPVLEKRLAAALAGRPDVSVTRRVVTDQREASRLGMHGSPTLLVNGTDPFPADATENPGLACRIYRDTRGRTDGAPSLAALKAAIKDAADD
jgi:hypothetical protein